jgi:Tfp pilus assembly protein PilX
MIRCRLSTLLLLVVLAALGLAMVAEYRQAARRKAEHRDRLAAAGQWWESFNQEESFMEKVSRWW